MRFTDEPGQYTLITDSQDLEPIVADLGITQFASEITGAMVDLNAAVDGEITPDDVWLTESSKPWSVYADWERPDYYADAFEDELFLQD